MDDGPSSYEPSRSDAIDTVQPPRRSSAASTKSWLRMGPPKGGLPDSTGSPAQAMKASVRMMALWPQNVASLAAHQAIPSPSSAP